MGGRRAPLRDGGPPAPDAPRGEAPHAAPAATLEASPGPAAPAVAAPVAVAARSTSATAPPPVSAEACARDLEEARARLASEQRQRREIEGAPIARPADLAARFRQESLLGAATLALRQSRVPGRVETIDCSEHPCITYGRLLGDEDLIERLERASAFAPYAGDVLTLLSWSATDEGALAAGHNKGTRPERMLIAIAIYGRDERARLGDAIDRRVRVRTAELWNAIRPDDEE